MWARRNSWGRHFRSGVEIWFFFFDVTQLKMEAKKLRQSVFGGQENELRLLDWNDYRRSESS